MSDPLFQPFQLKHLRLRNRILSTSHEPSYAENAKPKLRYQLYHEEKAKGGIALTMFGGSSNVAVDSPSAFGQIYAGDDSIIPYFRELAERVHRHGAALMCQITHMGRRTYWDTDHWLPTIAPSPVREPAHRSIPKEMEPSDIRRVIRAYAAAARRCRDGGLDGVEVEAYGHLFDSFWTPLVNRRADCYGGSLDNRMRFSLDALGAVRKAVGDDFIVGLRMSVDESTEGGLTADECTEIARRLVATGTLDFLSLVKGNVATDEALSHMIPNMGTPTAPHLSALASIRRAVSIPIFHAARIVDVATARHAVSSGLVDMVGMTRAQMADPYLPAKIERGEEDRIRPCIGMGYCIDRIYTGRDSLCIHNAATGREGTMPHIVPRATGRRRRVVIVGAGPAGLEAARVSAERGHEVVLFEAAAKVGGQLRLAARAPRRREILGVADWLSAEISRLGVDLRLHRLAEGADVLAERPDVVIIATGGVPSPHFLSDGAELVVSSWDILRGGVAPAKRILFFDDRGNHESYSCVELLAMGGSTVELVSPDRAVAQEIGGTNYPAYFKTFYERGVTITLNHRLTAVRRTEAGLVASLYNEYTKSLTERTVDQVVFENGTLPTADVYFALQERSSNGGEVDLDALISGRPQGDRGGGDGRYQLFRIGDAVASRNVHAAMYDALRLCKDL
ncbi:MAG TPA: FAD-dependent oxidoreductase [Gemmatimonadaceae bacterium]|nr:FAD-dependent oxidoreductase [Gemmatimonadaceae bacterium]